MIHWKESEAGLSWPILRYRFRTGLEESRENLVGLAGLRSQIRTADLQSTATRDAD
jgi:hypothetical protein